MRLLIIFTVILLLLSCGSSKKALRKKQPSPPAPVTVVQPTIEEPVVPAPPPPAKPEPIKEVEEKLLPVENKLPDPHRYFVITGSFRNPENAKRFLSQLAKQNFKPEILRSESGFYRVSVMATDEINKAREEIYRIRSAFQNYSDTWLLIQKK